eukprot:s3871_g4.t6
MPLLLMMIVGTACPANLYFNFYSPRRIEVALDMGLAAFIILLMIFVSANLNQTLHKLVVQPMESMLSVVKDNASQLLKQFGLEDDMEADEDLEETELLEGIFKKFARLASLAAGRNEATAEELAGMDESARGVMMEMMNVQVSTAAHVQETSANTSLRASAVSAPPTGSEGLEESHHVMALSDLPDVPVIASLPVSRDHIESFDLDVLDLDSEGQSKVAIHIFFDTAVGKTTGRYWSEALTFKRFHAVVKAGYNNLPYHNYTHACDVLHTVYRLLSLTSARQWLGSVDQYALLVAALCHDIGHQGRTNPFLVELGNELALRYNDKSPLENMHCAKLFEIASNQDTDVFKQMDKETKKQARRICIAAILHTDNVNHFEMVREISKIYEMASDLCELQASQPDLLPQYIEQVMQKNSLQWLELFLHFADVSNPLKPFPVCQKWAWRVLDEFFEQGDEEKSLGLPVGMLNDRDKINRPGSQHGFIQFLVAPLVFGTVRIFPDLHPVSTQMAENLAQWKTLWVEDAHPSEEDVAKKEADVQKIKDISASLWNHGDGDCSLCHMPQLAHDFVQRFGLQHAYLRSRGQSWEQRWEEREAHQEATELNADRSWYKCCGQMTSASAWSMHAYKRQELLPEPGCRPKSTVSEAELERRCQEIAEIERQLEEVASKPCFICETAGHTASLCTATNCHACRQFGHEMRTCPSLGGWLCS